MVRSAPRRDGIQFAGEPAVHLRWTSASPTINAAIVLRDRTLFASYTVAPGEALFEKMKRRFSFLK